MRNPSSCKQQVSVSVERHAYDLAAGRMFYTVMRVRHSVCGQMEPTGIWRICVEIENQAYELVRKEGYKESGGR
jgi:hypothetical protein